MAQLCTISLSLIGCLDPWLSPWIPLVRETQYLLPACRSVSALSIAHSQSSQLKRTTLFTSEGVSFATSAPSRSFFVCVLMQGDLWWLWQAVSVMTAQCGVCHVALTGTFWCGVRRGQAVGEPPVPGITRLKEMVPDLTYRGIFKPWHPSRSFHCLSPCRLAQWHTNTSLREQMGWSRALRLNSGEGEGDQGRSCALCVCLWVH